MDLTKFAMLLTGTFGLTSAGASAIFAIIQICVANGTLTASAAIAIAGATVVGGLAIVALFGVGAAVIKKKYKLGKKSFIAW